MDNISKHKDYILRSLESYKGDDAQRAILFFSKYSEDEMQEQHGLSGKTREEVLQDYLDQEKRGREAIEYIKSL